MRKKIFILGLVVIIIVAYSGFVNKSEISLVFNLKPAERFISVMNYIEQKNPNGYNYKNIMQFDKNINFQLNKKDIQLNKLIDSLLTLPIYEILSEKMASYIDTFEYNGIEAYRNAFLSLPFDCIKMRGGLSERWIEFWKRDFDSKAIIFISEIDKQKNEIIKKVVKLNLDVLPKKIENNLKIEIVFCLDGNKGSFTTDNKIIIDLINYNYYNNLKISNTIAHELNHILYSKYLDKYILVNNKSLFHKVLLSFQERIILEGVAQQMNFDDYSNQVKLLYFNEKLIIELYNEWINIMREISKSNNPIGYYNKEKNEMWNKRGIDRLKKYCFDEINSETLSQRPTIEYYISYHLYNSILLKGSKKKLLYVIENPDCLLQEYNNIYSKSLLIPLIPNDIVDLWRKNLKN